MAKEIVNIGSTPNDQSGDSLRVAFSKINTNFTELYAALGLAADVNLNLGNFVFEENTIRLTNSTNDDSTATQIEIAQPVRIESNLTVGGDIVPSGNLTSTLGSPSNKFHSIYVGTGSVYLGDAKLSLQSGRLNSSVGFSTDSLHIGGVTVTVNEDGALYSDGGFVGASVGTVDWADITAKPTIISNLSTDGILGFASSNTISEEIPGGTISETTTNQSQIEIDTNGVTIARRVIQVVDDGVVTATDEAGSTLEVNNSGAYIKHYAEPDGPNNSSYFQFSASNLGAVIEGIQQDVSSDTIGRVTVTQGAVVISTSINNINNEWIFNEGILTLPSNSYLESTDVNLKVGAQGTVTIRSNAASNLTDREWEFNKSGTVTTPLMLPATFTAVLDDAHRTVGGTIVGDPWQYTVSFVVGLGGVVETQIDNPDWPTNPGYAPGDEFEFAEADHGIPGFTFAVTINGFSEIPGTGFVVVIGVTPPPEYPSTFSSLGAIKLSANTSDWVFDPNGTLHYPDGSFGSTAFVGTAQNISDIGNVTITSNSDTTPQTWTFKTDGELQVPGQGSIRQNNSWTKTVAPTVSIGPGTVVWSSNVDYISSAKLTIQVEGNEVDDVSGWHSQACEAIIACRGYANTYGGPGGDPQMIVYGIVHTSVNPLVTFTVQRNPTTKFVEVVGTLTAAASGNASLRIHSVEMSTRD